MALGASRGRVVRQLLAEGLVLALLAAGVGVLISRVALAAFSEWILTAAPPPMLHRMRIPELSFDSHVAVYAALLAGATVLLFALAPAAQATRSALRGEIGGLRSSMLRNGLVVGQVALCVMLLAAFGLLLRGTGRIVGVDRGYDTEGVFGIGAYYLSGDGSFFDLVKLPILRGRTFTSVESEQQLPVAVINESMAKALWPGQEAIGKAVALGESSGENAWRPRFNEAIVIGVVRDFVVKAKEGGPRPLVFFADKLRPGTIVTLRGRSGSAQTRRLLNDLVARSAAGQHGALVVALEETTVWETYPQMAVSWLATILGGVALLLTISGIYGVMAYLVSQRTKEIGIRIALGATRGHVARFVVSSTARLGGIGVLFGVVLAVGVLQYLGSKMELAMDLLDVPAYLLTVAAGAALLAVFWPARRACKIDPQAALRAD